MKWELFITKLKGKFLFWTFKKDVGYVYEGFLFDKRVGTKYYKNYIWLLNNCFPMGRSLIGYKIRESI